MDRWKPYHDLVRAGGPQGEVVVDTVRRRLRANPSKRLRVQLMVDDQLIRNKQCSALNPEQRETLAGWSRLETLIRSQAGVPALNGTDEFTPPDYGRGYGANPKPWRRWFTGSL